MLDPRLLIPENLARFVDGEFVLENELEGYSFVGTIESIGFNGTQMVVRFKNIRRTLGDPDPNDGCLEYVIDFVTVANGALERTKLYIDTTPILWEQLTVTCSKDQATAAPPIVEPPLVADSVLQSYVGGDVEYHLGHGDSEEAWRGPIREISGVDNILVLSCHWLGYTTSRGLKWKKANRTEFRWNLREFTLQTNDTRLIIAQRNGMAKGLIVLFPPGRNLDPAKVEEVSVS